MNFLQWIVDDIPFIIGGVDMDYKIMFFNKQFENECKSASDVEIENGMDIRDMIRSLRVGSEYTEEMISYWDRCLKGETFSVVEPHQDIKQDLYEITYSPLYQEGKQIGGYVYSKNITEYEKNIITLRKRADDANRAKNKYLSRMSHELRTPLNSILGFSKMIKMDVGRYLDDSNQENIDHIIQAGEYLLNLVNDVLDITRIENHDLRVNPQKLCLYDTMCESIALVKPLALDSNIEIKFETRKSDCYINADKKHIIQIFTNLLSNAIKYNKRKGSVIIRVVNINTDSQIKVDITDTGIGIKEDMLDKLFIPFERLGAERTSIEGTGLGLVLTKMLVEMMGGEITVKSIYGVGSTFSVILNTTSEGNSDIIIDEEVIVIDRDVQKTILYIEDNLSNYSLVDKIVKQFTKYKMISTIQGKIGIDLAKKHKPNIILLDLNLPDINGEEVIQILKNDSMLSNIPVVVVSADANEERIRKLKELGAKYYITKPIDIMKFIEILRSIN